MKKSDNFSRPLAFTIRMRAIELKAKTAFIDKNLPELRAGKMPEYQKAMEAIEVYADAIQTKSERLYQK